MTSATTPVGESRLVYVIEKGTPAQYFAGFDYGAGKWTFNYWEAMHFSNRELAERIWASDEHLFTIFNDGVRIVEHMEIAGPQAETVRPDIPAAAEATASIAPSESSATSDSAMLVRLIELIRAMDLQATKITRVDGDEEVVEGYKFNTGCWHRILGSIAGHDCAKWLQTPEGQARVREASERAKQTIEELRGDRPSWDEIKDKRFTV